MPLTKTQNQRQSRGAAGSSNSHGTSEIRRETERRLTSDRNEISRLKRLLSVTKPEKKRDELESKLAPLILAENVNNEILDVLGLKEGVLEKCKHPSNYRLDFS